MLFTKIQPENFLGSGQKNKGLFYTYGHDSHLVQ